MTQLYQNVPEKVDLLPLITKKHFGRCISMSDAKNLSQIKSEMGSQNGSICSFAEEEAHQYNNLPLSFKSPERRLNTNVQTSSNTRRESIYEDLPPPNPLVKEKSSLAADMIFGWKPKHIMKGPVALRFPSPIVEDVVSLFTDQENREKFPELVYQGFRPENSFFMHEKFSSPETYTFKFSQTDAERHALFWKHIKSANVNEPRPFIGMKQGVDSECLIFDSIYENGNLDTVVRKSTHEYDLFLRVDSNTKGHTNWYYFKTRNMKRGQKVKFNIVNLSRFDSLYQRGMKPFVHSEKLSENENISWEQVGENITYKQSYISYMSESFEESNQKRHYKVSFEYVFNYEDDVVSFALGVPYTYSHLLQFIQGHINLEKDSYFTATKLCSSLGGVDVPLLTITDPDESEVHRSRREYIILTARVHPGETNSSWMIQGLINQICSDNDQAKELRRRFIFKIVPMLNPDGVIIGNHRTGMCGNDLNRQFISPNEMLHPSIKAVKDFVKDILDARPNSIFAYIDFHGHSLRKNVFMYGPEFPIHSPNYYKAKVLPRILSNRTPMFRFQSCRYTIPKSKLGTARAVFSGHYEINNCYTLEASYSAYINLSKEAVPFTMEGYVSMGCFILDGIYDYKQLVDEDAREAEILKAKQEALKVKREIQRSEIRLSIEAVNIEITMQKDSESVEKKEVEDEMTIKARKRANTVKVKKTKVNKSEKKLRKNESEPPEKVKNFKDIKSKVRELIMAKTDTSAKKGINDLLDQIKEEIKSEKHDYGKEGEDSGCESDIESPDDNFNANELKKIQKEMINNIVAFDTMCKNDNLGSLKKDDKVKKHLQSKVKRVKKKPNSPVPERELPEPIPQPSIVQIIRSSPSPQKNFLIPRYPQRSSNNFPTPLKQRLSFAPKEMHINLEKALELAQSNDQYTSSTGNHTGATKKKIYPEIKLTNPCLRQRGGSESFHRKVDSLVQQNPLDQTEALKGPKLELLLQKQNGILNSARRDFLPKISMRPAIYQNSSSLIGEMENSDLEPLSRELTANNNNIHTASRSLPKPKRRLRNTSNNIPSMDFSNSKMTLETLDSKGNLGNIQSHINEYATVVNQRQRDEEWKQALERASSGMKSRPGKGFTHLNLSQPRTSMDNNANDEEMSSRRDPKALVLFNLQRRNIFLKKRGNVNKG